MPAVWPEELGNNPDHIHVKNPAGVQQGVAAEVWLDGERLTGPEIPLQDDGQNHQVEVLLGPK